MGDNSFFKYPRTKHIFTAHDGIIPRDDLLMTSDEAGLFLLHNQKVVIEEKVDGANLGFSISSNNEILVQNRAHYINSKTHRQFNVLDNWIEKHSASLFKLLRPNRDILFGEWLYAKHSLHYTTLPDYFLAFDIYDNIEKCFFNIKKRNELLQNTNISSIRVISEETNLNKESLLEYLESSSQYYNGFVEGIILRLERDTEPSLNGNVFLNRGKVVRSDFIQQIEESWTKQKFTKNILLNY